MFRNIQIIAEVKTQSPFGFRSDKTWDELFVIANAIGDIISIHTDGRWGGSFDLVRKAKGMTDKPILAKGIHATDDLIREAFDAGADWTLVVGRVPEFQPEKCFIEPQTLDELKALPTSLRAVWNARDLQTGGAKKETFEDARAAWGGWLCQASFIETTADIHPNANAVLVGTALEGFATSLRAG